jgi:predicted RNase H-like nuclease (RuvC/YqgF family)
MGYGDGRTDDFVSGRGFAEAMDNIADTFRQREQNRVESEYLSQIRALQQKLSALQKHNTSLASDIDELVEQRDVWRDVARELADERGLDKPALKERVDRRRGLR